MNGSNELIKLPKLSQRQLGGDTPRQIHGLRDELLKLSALTRDHEASTLVTAADDLLFGIAHDTSKVLAAADALEQHAPEVAAGVKAVLNAIPAMLTHVPHSMPLSNGQVVDLAKLPEYLREQGLLPEEIYEAAFRAIADVFHRPFLDCDSGQLLKFRRHGLDTDRLMWSSPLCSFIVTTSREGSWDDIGHWVTCKMDGFLQLGFGQQLLRGTCVPPKVTVAAHIATAVTLENLRPWLRQILRENLADLKGCQMVLKWIETKLLDRNLIEDEDDLLDAFDTFYAITRAHCYSHYVLQPRRQIYQARADEYKRLAKEAPDEGSRIFYDSSFNTNVLMQKAFETAIVVFADVTNKADTFAGSVATIQELLDADIPTNLNNAFEDQMRRLNDWLVCLSQLQVSFCGRAARGDTSAKGSDMLLQLDRAVRNKDTTASRIAVRSFPDTNLQMLPWEGGVVADFLQSKPDIVEFDVSKVVNTVQTHGSYNTTLKLLERMGGSQSGQPTGDEAKDIEMDS